MTRYSGVMTFLRICVTTGLILIQGDHPGNASTLRDQDYLFTLRNMKQFSLTDYTISLTGFYLLLKEPDVQIAKWFP